MLSSSLSTPQKNRPDGCRLIQMIVGSCYRLNPNACFMLCTSACAYACTCMRSRVLTQALANDRACAAGWRRSCLARHRTRH
eukprot:2350608-Pleurochrysis_carterae.AAC.1